MMTWLKLCETNFHLPGSTRRGGESSLSSLQIVIAIWAGWTRTWGQCSNWGSKLQILFHWCLGPFKLKVFSLRTCCSETQTMTRYDFSEGWHEKQHVSIIKNFWRGQSNCQGLAMVKHEIEDVGFEVFDMPCMTFSGISQGSSCYICLALFRSSKTSHVKKHIARWSGTPREHQS